MTTRIHLLDVGTEKYGDALLCEVERRLILVDAGHRSSFVADGDRPGLGAQIATAAGLDAPVGIDLLVISHAHLDHVGCMPELVHSDVRPAWAFVPDPELAFPEPFASSHWDAPAIVALREEDLRSLPDDVLEQTIMEAASLRERYVRFIDALRDSGTKVVFHGGEPSEMLAEFADVQLTVLGPDREHLEATAELLRSTGEALVPAAEQWGNFTGPIDAAFPLAIRYRQMFSDEVVAQIDTAEGFDAVSLFEMQRRAGAVVNAQSCVLTLDGGDGRVLLAGDMQFADPEVPADVAARVRDLWDTVTATGPYAFVKLSHHGSTNANPDGFTTALDCSMFGICTGSNSHDHPAAAVLDELGDAHGIHWARTDHNGLCTVALGTMDVEVSRGTVNDSSPNA